MIAFSSMPFCPGDGRWVNPWYLSAVCRYTAQCQRELETLQHQEDQGKIDLYYFDESGFTLDPYIPYAWQEPGTVIEIPATKGIRINIVGLMNRKNDLHPYM